VTPWRAWAEARNDVVRASGRWREIRDLDRGTPNTTVTADGRPVVSFASNDYLGLSQHPAVVAAAHAALDEYGVGSGSARLIVGARPVHSALERALAAWKAQPAALLFPTGYQANLATLATFASDPGVLVVSDELNHASIIDGARLARGSAAVFRHRDVEHAASLVRSAERAIVVSDTVFSMDGDVAPVDDLAELCASTGSLLVLDEAHAVLGPPTPDRPDLDVVVVGTLSKTLGALGGFVATSEPLRDLLVNAARPFIFTTATPPSVAAAALAALRVVTSEEGDALVARLRRHVDRVEPGHPSPIVPVVVGEEADALALSSRLLDRGLLVPAIRPPTVPVGTSRLRIALSAAHDDDHIDRLLAALADLGTTARAEA
jgi:8-amino-7-oxononanoate synthase